MKIIRRYWFSCLALALAASCCVGPANAQVSTGKFSLPFEAHWGLATLPAGDYSFKLERGGPSGMLHVYSGKKAVALVITQSCNPLADEGNTLLVAPVHGKRFIRELRLGQTGFVFYYGAPRARHVDEREIGQLIPVRWSGQ